MYTLLYYGKFFLSGLQLFFLTIVYMGFSGVFSRKNLNLVAGLITLLIVLWVVMFAVPSLFVSLFDTNLGNMILIAFIFLAGVYNMNLAIGLSVVFIILWRFSHMSSGLMMFESFVL